MSSRWTTLGRPMLARGVATGLALALASLPVAALICGAGRLGGAPWSDVLRMLATIAGLFAAAGLLGGAPGAWLEARARARGAGGPAGSSRKPGGARALLVAGVCGSLPFCVGFVIVAQLRYVEGVARGGVDGGMTALGRMVSGAQRDAGMVLAVVGGTWLALTVCLGLVVLLRLRDVAARWQVAAGILLALGGGLALMGVGALVLMLLGSAGAPDIDALMLESPFAGGLLLGTVWAGFVLAAVGLPLALVLPGALVLAERRGGAVAPPAPAEDVAPATPGDGP